MGMARPITYAVMGLLPAKIIIARDQFPLPPERTQEHKRWPDASRRYWVRVTDMMRLFMGVRLTGYSIGHGVPGLKTTIWLHWLFFTAYLVILFVMFSVLIQGSVRLVALGRDLLPIGSWSSPFRPARLMSTSWLSWCLGYVLGLALLFVLFAS